MLFVLQRIVVDLVWNTVNNVNFCRQCYDDHRKSRFTKSHQVITASEGEAFTKSKVPPYPPCHCHKHQLMDLYCCTCNVPICTTCSHGVLGWLLVVVLFRPHPGRVIRDLFRLLDAVTALYGSTSLQQSSKGSCSLLVSGYNLRADCQWRTLVPPLNSGANAEPASVLALM